MHSDRCSAHNTNPNPIANPNLNLTLKINVTYAVKNDTKIKLHLVL